MPRFAALHATHQGPNENLAKTLEVEKIVRACGADGVIENVNKQIKTESASIARGGKV